MCSHRVARPPCWSQTTRSGNDGYYSDEFGTPVATPGKELWWWARRTTTLTGTDQRLGQRVREFERHLDTQQKLVWLVDARVSTYFGAGRKIAIRRRVCILARRATSTRSQSDWSGLLSIRRVGTTWNSIARLIRFGRDHRTIASATRSRCRARLTVIGRFRRGKGTSFLFSDPGSIYVFAPSSGFLAPGRTDHCHRDLSNSAIRSAVSLDGDRRRSPALAMR
jgi:hypothetical protein